MRLSHLITSVVVCLANSTPELIAQSPIERTARADLRLDGERELFSNISRMYVTSNGNILVPQTADATILRYSAKGQKLGSFGRKGGGPGEFEQMMLASFGMIADTLWVEDPGVRRVTFFSADGAVLRSFNTTLSTSDNAKTISGRRYILETFSPEVILSSGVRIGRAEYAFTDSSARQTTRKSFVVAVDTKGVVSRTYASYPEFPPSRVRASVGRSTFSAPIPFSSGIAIRASQQGRYIVRVNSVVNRTGTADTHVLLMRPNGDTVYNRMLPLKLQGIRAQVFDSAITAAAEKALFSPSAVGEKPAVAPRSPQVVGAMKVALLAAVPKYYAPVRNVRVSDDGVVVLEVRTGENAFTQYLLSSIGQVSSIVRLPEQASVVYISRDTLWAAERDSDDVPSLVRYVLSGTGKRD